MVSRITQLLKKKTIFLYFCLYPALLNLSFLSIVLGYENGPSISEEEKANAMKNPAVNVTVDPDTIPWGSVGDKDGVMDRNVWDAR